MMDCFSIVLGLAFWFSKAYSMSNLCISQRLCESFSMRLLCASHLGMVMNKQPPTETARGRL